MLNILISDSYTFQVKNQMMNFEMSKEDAAISLYIEKIVKIVRSLDKALLWTLKNSHLFGEKESYVSECAYT